jgi:peptidoglycan hydrolase-like protein with peptidoglycan-binding domain
MPAAIGGKLMKKRAFAGLAVAMVLLFGAPAGSPLTFAAVPQEPAQGAGTVPATPELIRQIQFMLQTVGIDPGPIDGNAQALTNRAAHQFQFQNALPITDITNGGPISTAFLDLLRKEAGAKLGVIPNPPGQAAVPPAAPTPAPASVAPAPPPPPAPPPADRFASCQFDALDFSVGGKQYTPQSFLDEGFGGSTDRAVANLQQRLKEAREIAEKIGGSALLEVQRQARVLAYFECRQKIEQAAAGK